MRPPAIAVVSIVAALLGGAAALALGKAGGWIGGATTESYVVTEQAAAPAAVRTVAAPLVGRGFDPARIYARRAAGVVTVFAFFGGAAAPGAPEAQGSGFVVSSDGVVLTNSHVITNAGDAVKPAAIKPARQIVVQFSDGDRVPARVVGWDPFDDVGVLRVDPAAHALAPVPLGRSAGVVVGEPVAAIGSPFGDADSLSVGVVSATRAIASLTSEYQLPDAIQIDAPINHGNSGGPLFDARGRVIGINAQLHGGAPGGGAFDGVGFAVPIDAARRSLAQLLATGRVAYAYVGVVTGDLTPGIARAYGYPVLRGALVERVAPGTAAARAGLRAGHVTVDFAGEQVRIGGDVIVAIAGTPVRDAADVVRIVGGRLRPGQVVRFTVVRGSGRLDLPVRAEPRPLR